MTAYLQQFPYGNLLMIAILISLLYLAYHTFLYRSLIVSKKVILVGCSIFYAVFFASVYLLPKSFHASPYAPSIPLQQIPFQTILHSDYRSILGNILMLLPGSLLFYLHCGSLKKSTIFAVLLPLSIEPLQFLINTLSHFPNFVIDIDDLILQFLGSMLGLLFVIIGLQIS